MLKDISQDHEIIVIGFRRMFSKANRSIGVGLNATWLIDVVQRSQSAEGRISASVATPVQYSRRISVQERKNELFYLFYIGDGSGSEITISEFIAWLIRVSELGVLLASILIIKP